jgi:hypothetical protein
VDLGTPFGTCRKRNAARQASGTNTLNITEATFDQLAKGFEPMGPEEAAQ